LFTPTPVTTHVPDTSGRHRAKVDGMTRFETSIKETTENIPDKKFLLIITIYSFYEALK
jgi:hypothetical protein